MRPPQPQGQCLPSVEPARDQPASGNAAWNSLAQANSETVIRAASFLPFLRWAAGYERQTLANDLTAAAIVTIMLVPQSMAYALLAGLPPQIGLYASILPLVAYALFGTSRTLAVGPVAVISLMTATAAGSVATQGTPEYVAAALILALLSGGMLLIMGLLRLGFLANLLSHPVVSGFITASGVLIAVSQLRHIFGVAGGGETLPAMLASLMNTLPAFNPTTLLIGAAALLFLFWVRSGLKPQLVRVGIAPRSADLLTKVSPVVAVVVSAALVGGLSLDVATVGAIPKGLPPIGVPLLDTELWTALLMPALLIGIIGFVESVSVAQMLAAKRRQRIDPDQELLSLNCWMWHSSVGCQLQTYLTFALYR